MRTDKRQRCEAKLCWLYGGLASDPMLMQALGVVVIVHDLVR